MNLTQNINQLKSDLQGIEKAINDKGIVTDGLLSYPEKVNEVFVKGKTDTETELKRTKAPVIKNDAEGSAISLNDASPLGGKVQCMASGLPDMSKTKLIVRGEGAPERTYTPTPDGTVSDIQLNPYKNTILSDTEGVNINIKYNADSDKYIENNLNELRALKAERK